MHSRHRYYNELKEFMALSKQRWRKLYPKFRSHGDGDKLAAYKLVEGIDDLLVPKLFKKLYSVWELTSDILRQIPTDSFVVKAIFGNQGRRVICLHRKRINNTYFYKDILRHHAYNMNVGQVLSYIIHMFKRDEEAKGSALIIEEFVGNPERGLPQDYKLYTINQKVKLISIFGRRGRDEYANSYDANWKPIPITNIYKHPEALDYIEEKTPLDGLPSDEIRFKLISIAEKLAKKHDALFCRYDFYCVNNEISFGEITPVCGDLNNYRVLEEFSKYLLSSANNLRNSPDNPDSQDSQNTEMSRCSTVQPGSRTNKGKEACNKTKVDGSKKNGDGSRKNGDCNKTTQSCGKSRKTSQKDEKHQKDESHKKDDYKKDDHKKDKSHKNKEKIEK